jgi:hypothetical protein
MAANRLPDAGRALASGVQLIGELLTQRRHGVEVAASLTVRVVELENQLADAVAERKRLRTELNVALGRFGPLTPATSGETVGVTRLQNRHTTSVTTASGHQTGLKAR